ncbi:MAG: superoxide dismutase [Phycisphaerales bacterium]|nr:superoxide dismutase [Phycisphaerales bacterium]MCB9835484.1 superoxide dismutase [Phycisphaera sp.]
MPFTLPDLPYSYDALEPVIDARTMEIHHSKHHQGYVTKANDALKGTAFEGETVETVLSKLATVPDNVRTAVRNNAGGHANHSLFWEIMAPKGKGGEPSKGLMDAIVRSFNSLDAMKQKFSDAAATRFGSGWAWLVVRDGQLVVGSTPNQDSPLLGQDMCEFYGTPILGLDVWEHAYYLNYQNRRPDYVSSWWDIVNWNKVSELYEVAIA